MADVPYQADCCAVHVGTVYGSTTNCWHLGRSTMPVMNVFPSCHKTHDLLGASQVRYVHACEGVIPLPSRPNVPTPVHVGTAQPKAYGSIPTLACNPRTHNPAHPYCPLLSNIIPRFQFRFVAASDVGLFEPDILQARRVRGMG